MTSDAGTVIRLTFPAKAEYLLLARLALVGLARSLPFDTETVADLKLAVTEACGNVVHHAYASGGHVTVTYVVDGERFDMIVEDDGAGLTSPDLELDPADTGESTDPASHGMGMAIIRAVVDELDIGDRPEGAGTRVRMTKLLASRPSPSSP